MFSLGGLGLTNSWLFLDNIFTLLALIILTNIDSGTLHDLSLRGLNDWVLHLDGVSSGVQEQRGRRLDDAWHERWLDELEVVLLGRVVREDSALVSEVDLQVVEDREGLSVHGLWHEGVLMVVGLGVLEEIGALWVTSLGSDVE